MQTTPRSSPALTIRATITTKGHDGRDGYAVSVTLKENGISELLRGGDGRKSVRDPE